jgi:hypothetical protein
VNIYWSKQRALMLGIAIVAVTNAIALAGVAYNRSGEPVSTLQLTERELPLMRWDWLDNHNSGIDLDVAWRMKPATDFSAESRSYYYDIYDRSWLGVEAMGALGFDVSKPPTADYAARHYARMLQREALLVLEYDGHAYQQALSIARQRLAAAKELSVRNPGDREFAERLKAAQGRLRDEELLSSRLFVVDAGLEVDALRTKYPDRSRYAIVGGLLRVSVEEVAKQRLLTAHVTRLSVGRINVPHDYRALIVPLIRTDWRNADSPPRYAATVKFGQRLEPWIADMSVSNLGVGNAQ